MSPGLESRGRSISSMFTEGWLGWLHLRRQKKNNEDFAISKMIGKIFAPSHSHSFRKDKCYIRHVLLVMVGKSRTCRWGWSFMVLFTSGSTTHPRAMPHWNLFLPSTQSSNFTHNRNAFFASSFSSPIFLFKT